MKQNIINFLRASFPYIVTILLWRLSDRFWNPAGILALIPIFFCTFVFHLPWFGIFSIIFCFLIDYNMETAFFWTALFLLFYAVIGLQTLVDLSRMEYNAGYVFLIFIGVGFLLQFFTNITFVGLLRSVLLFLWCGTLYIPITTLIKKVRND